MIYPGRRCIGAGERVSEPYWTRPGKSDPRPEQHWGLGCRLLAFRGHCRCHAFFQTLTMNDVCQEDWQRLERKYTFTLRGSLQGICFNEVLSDWPITHMTLSHWSPSDRFQMVFCRSVCYHVLFEIWNITHTLSWKETPIKMFSPQHPSTQTDSVPHCRLFTGWYILSGKRLLQSAAALKQCHTAASLS